MDMSRWEIAQLLPNLPIPAGEGWVVSIPEVGDPVFSDAEKWWNDLPPTDAPAVVMVERWRGRVYASVEIGMEGWYKLTPDGEWRYVGEENPPPDGLSDVLNAALIRALRWLADVPPLPQSDPLSWAE